MRTIVLSFTCLTFSSMAWAAPGPAIDPCGAGNVRGCLAVAVDQCQSYGNQAACNVANQAVLCIQSKSNEGCTPIVTTLVGSFGMPKTNVSQFFCAAGVRLACAAVQPTPDSRRPAPQQTPIQSLDDLNWELSERCMNEGWDDIYGCMQFLAPSVGGGPGGAIPTTPTGGDGGASCRSRCDLDWISCSKNARLFDGNSTKCSIEQNTCYLGCR